jgi:predicted RNA binding protein YcfA (HicA-like mRNA interferase family)
LPGKLRPVEGRRLIKILCNAYGFRVIRQKGSHVTLTNGTIYVTVPAKEIRVGLLAVILKDCGIPRDEFLAKL